MRRIAFLMVIIMSAFIFSACFEDTITINDEQSLVRIHIRADSNDEEDQRVKLEVRDAVTNFLAPALNSAADFDDAYGIISRACPKLKAISDEVLRSRGFEYTAKVRLTKEFFPTRMYGNVVVESGNYDALIIELGSGKGDNWWCVVYPPLCYTGGGDKPVFKSKIKELIDRYS